MLPASLLDAATAAQTAVATASAVSVSPAVSGNDPTSCPLAVNVPLPV